MKGNAFLAFALVGLVAFSQGDVVITEILQNPSAVSDSNGEWFELYNTGPDTILEADILNWVFFDLDTDSAQLTSITGDFPPQSYFVFCRNNDPMSNGGVTCDATYATSLNFGNGADELVIEDGNSVELDRVEYDNGLTFPDPNGASMSLVSPNLDNSVGTNWCTATTAFASGDLGAGGAPNDCPLTSCSDGEVGSPGACEICPAGFYCIAGSEGNGTAFPCPSDSTSSPGSSSLTDCQCNFGFSGPDGGPCIAVDETNEAAGGSWQGMAQSGSIIDNGDGSVTVGCSGDMEQETVTYDVNVASYSIAIDNGVAQVSMFATLIINAVGPGDSALINFLFLDGMETELGAAFSPARSFTEISPLTIVEVDSNIPPGTRILRVTVTSDCGPMLKRAEETNITVGNIAVIMQNAQINGDPHFDGFDGSHYTFTGRSGGSYSLISDAAFQLNMKVAAGIVRDVDGTWITALGLVTPGHRIVVDAFRALVNDELLATDSDMTLGDGYLSYTAHDDGTPATLSVAVGGYSISIVKQSDGTFSYFDLKASLLAMPVHPHGILGQTAQFLISGARPEPQFVTGKDGEGFLEGTPNDYAVSSLTGTECNLCAYFEGLVATRSKIAKFFEATVTVS